MRVDEGVRRSSTDEFIYAQFDLSNALAICKVPLIRPKKPMLSAWCLGGASDSYARR
jgi:hypothetical protein